MPIPANKRSAKIRDVAPAADSFDKVKAMVQPGRDAVEIAAGIDGLRAFLVQHIHADAVADLDVKITDLAAAMRRERQREISAARAVRRREAAAKSEEISAQVQRLIRSIL